MLTDEAHQILKQATHVIVQYDFELSQMYRLYESEARGA